MTHRAPAILGPVAAAAKRALVADVLAVWVGTGSAKPVLLLGVESPLAEPPDWDALWNHTVTPRARESSEPAVPPWIADLGFETMVCVRSTELDGVDPVTICALRRDRGATLDRAIAQAYATHGALALCRRSTSRRPTVDGTALALALLAAAPMGPAALSEILAAHLCPRLGTGLGVMVWEPGPNVLRMLDGSFGLQSRDLVSYQVSTSDPQDSGARAFTTGAPYLTNRATADRSLLPEYVAALGWERLATVPLTTGTGRVGVLHMVNADHPFSVDDLLALEDAAERIAPIIDAVRRLFSLAKQQRVDAALSRFAEAIAAGTAMKRSLPNALAGFGRAIEADMVALVTPGADPDVWRRSRACHELEQIILREAAEGPGLRSYSVVSRGPSDPGWAACHVPLAVDTERIGTLAVLRRGGEPLTADERQSCARLASIVGLGVSATRYQEQRSELARLRERERIADGLHDDVVQTLFAAQLKLDRLLEHDGLAERVTEPAVAARGYLVRGATAIREVIQNLEPTPDEDLETRLIEVVNDIEDQFGLTISLDLPADVGAVGEQLSAAQADLMVRVAREALVNVSKHAQTPRAEIALAVAESDRLTLTVVDEGVGGAPEGPGQGYGLGALDRAARRHGGGIAIRSTSGGTRVVATVPL